MSLTRQNTPDEQEVAHLLSSGQLGTSSSASSSNMFHQLTLVLGGQTALAKLRAQLDHLRQSTGTFEAKYAPLAQHAKELQANMVNAAQKCQEEENRLNTLREKVIQAERRYVEFRQQHADKLDAYLKMSAEKDSVESKYQKMDIDVEEAKNSLLSIINPPQKKTASPPAFAMKDIVIFPLGEEQYPGKQLVVVVGSVTLCCQAWWCNSNANRMVNGSTQ